MRPAAFFLMLQVLTVCTIGARQAGSTDAALILNQVEQGIVDGDIGRFASHLGPQVAISMSNDWSGSYSTNQSFSILKNFFGMRKTVGFKFTTIHEAATSAYGTGGGSFLRRGMREKLQIYVRLTLIGKKWCITQINLY